MDSEQLILERAQDLVVVVARSGLFVTNYQF